MSQNIPNGQLWSRNIDEVYEIFQEVFGDDTEQEIIEQEQQGGDKVVEFIKMNLRDQHN